ncbi:MAG TPA: twin-arginine translocation signal domain-containing protein, partial [Casimicrobiaceae bacterium]|nr:twin-arginine translocation signal domain-containing protein [Casimicrobiaceae bacterium]
MTHKRKLRSRTHNASRRKLLKAGAAAATLGSLAPLSFPAIGQQVKVRYTLSWLPTGQYAFVYMARQLGFWKK